MCIEFNINITDDTVIIHQNHAFRCTFEKFIQESLFNLQRFFGFFSFVDETVAALGGWASTESLRKYYVRVAILSDAAVRINRPAPVPPSEG